MADSVSKIQPIGRRPRRIRYGTARITETFRFPVRRRIVADLPNLTPDQVAVLIPQASDIEDLGRGGQKLVFRGTIGGTVYALKFAKLPTSPVDDLDEFASSDIAIRAKREVETMRECTS